MSKYMKRINKSPVGMSEEDIKSSCREACMNTINVYSILPKEAWVEKEEEI